MAKPGQSTFANIGEVLTATPSDSVPFALDTTNNPRGWDYFFPYVLTTGNISFIDQDNNTRTLTGVPANQLLPIPIRQLRSTGTTATVLALIPK